MAEYQGMRWFKMDFQVQTPEDNRHWSDDDVRLQAPRRPIENGVQNEDDIQAKAKRFLLRCHELELEAIGITDHNFSDKTEPRDWFLTHLVEQNKTVAKELGRPPIFIFPGFEVDLGYHALCLFEPATKVSHLRRVNMILIKLGLAENQRFRGGIPTALRNREEAVSLKTLLNVIQKEHGGIVIAAHADQQDGLLSAARNIDDYKLPGLLALEVTTYPMPPRYNSILEGKDRNWSRDGRQPAYVQSSDAKSLKVGEDGIPLPNSLGYRHTWVKSSKPSISSLRQAFLDGKSRLRLQEARPSDEQTHPRIVFLKCRGFKFLADQQIFFSPNLNTLIGGRGTGKSTVLELLRFAFGRDKGDSFSPATQAKFDRVRATFTEEAEVQVGWESIPGQIDIISLKPQKGHMLLQGEAHDLEVFLRQLPVQFYSQQQLSELTGLDGGNSLLAMIDDACSAELQGLKGQEGTLRAEIHQLFAGIDQIDALADEVTVLKQELQELNRQWQARREVQEEAQRYQFAEAARRYFEQIRSQANEDVRRFSSLAESLSSRGALNDAQVEIWPRSEWFNQFTREAAKLRENYRTKAAELAAQLQQDMAKLFHHDDGWEQVSKELEATKEAFLFACGERGLQPQDVARLQEIDRTRQAKQALLQRKEERLDALAPQRERLNRALEEMNALWGQQFIVRHNTAIEINERAQRSIRIVMQKMADTHGFIQAWNKMAPDGRSRLGRAWEHIGKQFFENFSHLQQSADSPWFHIQQVMAERREFPLPLLEYKDELGLFFDAQAEAWRNTQLTRVEERVDIELYRADQTLVGSVQSKALSEGQRNTAVLNLLLAKGEGPIIIDQPEDELDSKFIYRELVPLLRKVKNQRQLILATHNANLPVNADTDLVYALEVAQGMGVSLATGGLDRTDTATAVLDIMEGSEEAFKRRFDKYHF
ncbi:TrlF family AAA-like ATPase [Pseudomonas fluorescens]|uniref:Phosphoesterase n=1 Tax=Pseudomonas fluorescens TaxID=294 RepID=A0AAE2DX66_PSEFL|nr:AAA family ATPase [Pseudomonas fluorescens]KIP94535.1 phosphoesterase [Pseudomonas fluorescens]